MFWNFQEFVFSSKSGRFHVNVDFYGQNSRFAPATASTAVKLRLRPFSGSALDIRHLRLFQSCGFGESESDLVVRWFRLVEMKHLKHLNLKVLRQHLASGTSRWLQSHKLMRLEARHMPPSNIILAIQSKSLIAISKKLKSVQKATLTVQATGLKYKESTVVQRASIAMLQHQDHTEFGNSLQHSKWNRANNP